MNKKNSYMYRNLNSSIGFYYPIGNHNFLQEASTGKQLVGIKFLQETSNFDRNLRKSYRIFNTSISCKKVISPMGLIVFSYGIIFT